MEAQMAESRLLFREAVFRFMICGLAIAVMYRKSSGSLSIPTTSQTAWLCANRRADSRESWSIILARTCRSASLPSRSVQCCCYTESFGNNTLSLYSADAFAEYGFNVFGCKKDRKILFMFQSEFNRLDFIFWTAWEISDRFMFLLFRSREMKYGADFWCRIYLSVWL